MFGRTVTINFKSDLEGYIFLAAVALEEVTFEDLQTDFGISPNTNFVPLLQSKEKQEPINFMDAEEAGYRVLAFKEQALKEDVKRGMIAATRIFSPCSAEQGEMLQLWGDGSGNGFYLLPHSVYNDYFLDCINNQFDKALTDISKAYIVKEQGCLQYLRLKPWISPYSEKALKADYGLKIVDFDVETASQYMYEGTLVPTNKYEEDLVKIIKVKNSNLSLMDRFLLKVTGEKIRQ